MEVAPIRAATMALVTWAESFQRAARVLEIAMRRAGVALGAQLREIDAMLREIDAMFRHSQERP